MQSSRKRPGRNTGTIRISTLVLGVLALAIAWYSILTFSKNSEPEQLQASIVIDGRSTESANREVSSSLARLDHLSRQVRAIDAIGLKDY